VVDRAAADGTVNCAANDGAVEFGKLGDSVNPGHDAIFGDRIYGTSV
jgi:hypothetical protein